MPLPIVVEAVLSLSPLLACRQLQLPSPDSRVHTACRSPACGGGKSLRPSDHTLFLPASIRAAEGCRSTWLQRPPFCAFSRQRSSDSRFLICSPGSSQHPGRRGGGIFLFSPLRFSQVVHLHIPTSASSSARQRLRCICLLARWNRISHDGTQTAASLPRVEKPSTAARASRFSGHFV